MTPTETLKHEHQVILMVLDAAERDAQAAGRGEKISGDRAREILDFIRTFADKCHHAKEEKLLFVRMQERGMSGNSGPIAVMLHEHNLGRNAVRATAEALPEAEKGDREALAAFAENLQSYVNLLREHIYKEDNVLYPMADRLLTPEDQSWLDAEFERVEVEEIGEGTHEKYHELAHQLAGE